MKFIGLILAATVFATLNASATDCGDRGTFEASSTGGAGTCVKNLAAATYCGPIASGHDSGFGTNNGVYDGNVNPYIGGVVSYAANVTEAQKMRVSAADGGECLCIRGTVRQVSAAAGGPIASLFQHVESIRNGNTLGCADIRERYPNVFASDIDGPRPAGTHE